jgi:hypothetical protein
MRKTREKYSTGSRRTESGIFVVKRFREGTVSYGGHAVAQLVEALRYKPEGRGFDSRGGHSNFSLTMMPRYGPGVDSASNRNEYQVYILGGKGGRCVGLTTLPR